MRAYSGQAAWEGDQQVAWEVGLRYLDLAQRVADSILGFD